MEKKSHVPNQPETMGHFKYFNGQLLNYWMSLMSLVRHLFLPLEQLENDGKVWRNMLHNGGLIWQIWKIRIENDDILYSLRCSTHLLCSGYFRISREQNKTWLDKTTQSGGLAQHSWLRTGVLIYVSLDDWMRVSTFPKDTNWRITWKDHLT